MTKGKDILARAEELAAISKTWADLSNALFDPLEGEVARTFSSSEERAAFRKTPEYQRLHEIVESKMEATGVLAGATPRKSGRFVVRLPRSLHAALEKEAADEGTSLNQLVVAKLAVRLDNLRGGRMAAIIQAFAETRDGYSADRLIVDPCMNRRFLHRCRELGLLGTDFELNWELMRARKNGELSGLPKTKKYTVQQRDDFEYASELAVKHLQLTDGASLDRILCDPVLAERFDEYAARLAPGFSPLDYRWAALGLRKAGRLKALKDEIGRPPKLQRLGSVEAVRPEEVPEVAGLYLLSSEQNNVYMSQTENLRRRVERHVEVSDSHGLPPWLWNIEEEPLCLSVAPLPRVNKVVRQAMELVLLRKLKPVLNLDRRAA